MTTFNTLATCKEILTAHEAGVGIEIIFGAVALLFLGALAYKAVTSTVDVIKGKAEEMFCPAVIVGGFALLGLSIIVFAALS